MELSVLNETDYERFCRFEKEYLDNGNDRYASYTTPETFGEVRVVIPASGKTRSRGGKSMEKNRRVRTTIFIELGIMAAIVLFDLGMPALLIIAVGLLFMLLRKEGLSLLGFKIEKPIYKTVFSVFLLSVIWTIINFTVILPIINHLTGATRILTNFENLKGNTGLLLTLLAASWTLAALGEEIAYRGFLLGGTARLFTNRKFGIVVSVLVSSVLFGLAHREQGLIGVITTFIDALFFSFVRYRFDNLWASVFAHGFLNSIGIITFYFTGPLYGLW